GVDGIEGERGFARARKPGEHHQLVARDFEIDVLEVVLARAPDRDHARALSRCLAAWAALVEEVVHAVRRRHDMREARAVTSRKPNETSLSQFAGAAPRRNVVRTGRFR